MRIIWWTGICANAAGNASAELNLLMFRERSTHPSRNREMDAKESDGIKEWLDDRPHPGPLPRGEGASVVCFQIARSASGQCSHRFSREAAGCFPLSPLVLRG